MVRRCGLLVLTVLMALMFTGVNQAQDNEKKIEKAASASKMDRDPSSFYKLDLTVREMDGSKPVNARTYTLNSRTNEWSRFRVGSKIPINPGNGINYVDLGLNADCHLMDNSGEPSLGWTIDLTTVAQEMLTTSQHPVIRTVRSQGEIPLTLGKPTVLSSSDDLNSTHKFVFEVTATKVK
jgi:hypothetical protein